MVLDYENIYKSPPDLNEAKKVSKSYRLYMDEDAQKPYGIFTPIEKLTNLSIEMQIYLKSLVHLLYIAVAMVFLFTLPTILINTVIYVMYYKRKEDEIEPVFNTFLDIVIYPLKEMHVEGYLEVFSNELCHFDPVLSFLGNRSALPIFPIGRAWS